MGNSQSSDQSSQVQPKAGAPASAGLPPDHPPVPQGSSCPVTPAAREAWTRAAATARANGTEADVTTQKQSSSPKFANSRLGTARQVSTIPRALPPSDTNGEQTPATNHATAANSESLSEPKRSDKGTWIYPSEKMFFDAMRRKGHEPQSRDMNSVVPMHNAVNERTWQHILEWERPYVTAKSAEHPICKPALVSFEGDASKISPKARVNSWLGYRLPFDRHDWVVDRCGTRVEYVIDYYQGKPSPQGPSFYLDVRPKLNSLEGVKMRAARSLGLV